MELIGNKDRFGIEIWPHPIHKIWGSYRLWFENQEVGEVNEESEVHFGTLESTLQDIIKGKMNLFDNSFVAKTDNQILEIVFNALFNGNVLESKSQVEIDNLFEKYNKFVFTSEIPIDGFLILNLYYKDSNQFKFLITKNLEGEDKYEPMIYSVSIKEREFIDVANEYSRRVKELSEATQDKEME